MDSDKENAEHLESLVILPSAIKWHTGANIDRKAVVAVPTPSVLLKTPFLLLNNIAKSVATPNGSQRNNVFTHCCIYVVRRQRGRGWSLRRSSNSNEGNWWSATAAPNRVSNRIQTSVLQIEPLINPTFHIDCFFLKDAIIGYSPQTNDIITAEDQFSSRHSAKLPVSLALAFAFCFGSGDV